MGRFLFLTFRTIWNGNWSATRTNLPVLVNGSCLKQAESLPSRLPRCQPVVKPAVAQNIHLKGRCAKYASSLDTTSSPATCLRTIFPVLVAHCTPRIPIQSRDRQIYGAWTVNLMGKCPCVCLFITLLHRCLDRHIAADCPHSMDVF